MEAPRGVDAQLAALAPQALVVVQATPPIPSQEEPFPAGALVAPRQVGTGVGTAAIGGCTLVDIVASVSVRLQEEAFSAGALVAPFTVHAVLIAATI